MESNLPVLRLDPTLQGLRTTSASRTLAPAEDPGLAKILAAEAARFPGKFTAYVKHLTTGAEASVGGDEPRSAMSVIKQQGEMLKSLHEKVQKIGNQGAGRKATVSVTEKPVATMAKSEPTGMDAGEFLAKSEGAFNAGRITGLELSTIETFINRVLICAKSVGRLAL